MLRQFSKQVISASLRLTSESAKKSGARWSQYNPRASTWTDSRGYEYFESRKPWWTSVPWYSIAAGSIFAYVTVRTYCSQEVPYTKRRHIVWWPAAWDVKLGEQSFAALKQQFGAHILPPTNPLVKKVEEIGGRIAKYAADGHGRGFYSHMTDLKWEYVVVDQPIVNAMVIPGGKVVVFTGLVDLIGAGKTDPAESVSELASVLAHETAHIVARHTAEMVSQNVFWSTLSLMLYVLFGIPPAITNTTVAVGISLPYSRQNELEADHIGMILMSRACFDPHAAPRMMTKLRDMERRLSRTNIGSSILSTHPPGDDRIKKMNSLLNDCEQVYAESGCAAPRSFWSSFSQAQPI